MSNITQITYGIKVKVFKEDYAYKEEGEEESNSIEEEQFAEEHDESVFR